MENSVMISGFGGQGVMLIGKLLGYAAKEAGKNVTFYPAYGPEQRGGTANCTIVISDDTIFSPTPSKVDVLIAMNEPSVVKYLDKVKSNGSVIINSSQTKREIERDDVTSYYLKADEVAQDCGSIKSSNMVLLGKYLSVSNSLEVSSVLDTMRHMMENKKGFVEINEKAITLGENS